MSSSPASRRSYLAIGLLAASLVSGACAEPILDPTTLSFVSSESSQHLLVRYTPTELGDGPAVVVDLPANAQGIGLLSTTSWEGRLEILTQACVVTGSLRVRPGVLNFALVIDDGEPIEVTSADVLEAETEESLQVLPDTCATD